MSGKYKERPPLTQRIPRWWIGERPSDMKASSFQALVNQLAIAAEDEVGWTGGAVAPLKYLIYSMTELSGEPRHLKTSSPAVAQVW